MKIIIPMAGMGKRMRPHTLTIPKPLLRIAGKPIIHRLVEDIVEACSETVDEIAFIIGDFGKEIEENLISIALQMGIKGCIYHQDKPMGTAHAVLCASDSLKGNVVVAFADTLFKASFKIDTSKDGIIWTHRVEDPTAFGVVRTDENETITGFYEKPKEFISNQAIIGIYYFNDGVFLKNELQYLVDNKLSKNGEYQLTDALQNMMDKGCAFKTGEVDEWLDCGNKDATVYTNQRILEHSKNKELIDKTANIKNSVIIPPCFIGEYAVIENSIVGPYVSLGEHTKMKHCIVSNSIIETNTIISNSNIDNSMIGNFVEYRGDVDDVSIGDYTLIFRSPE